MKKIIAIWIVCALLLSCVWAGAEEQAGASDGWRLSNDMSVDPVLLHDLLDRLCPNWLLRRQAEKAGVLMNAIEPALTVADNGVQLDIGVNGKTALSLGGARTDGGVAIASSLFPSYVIYVPTGKLTEIVSQIKPMVSRPKKARAKDAPADAALPPESDPPEVAPDVDAAAQSDSDESLPVEEMSQYISVETPESGEYQVNGVYYDVMRTYNLNCNGLVGMWNTFADWVFRNKGIANLVEIAKKADVEINVDQVKGLLPSDALPRLSVTYYASNTTADRYITATATSEDGAKVYGDAQLQITEDDVTATARAPLLPLDVDFKMHRQGGLQAELDVRGKEPLLYVSFNAEEGPKGQLDINAAGNYLGSDFEITAYDSSGEGLHMTANLYYTDARTPLLREELILQPHGALTLNYNDEKKTVVPITSLVNVNNGYLLGFALDIAFNGIAGLLNASTNVMSDLKKIEDAPVDAAEPAPVEPAPTKAA